MINQDNYYKKISEIDFSIFPESLKESKAFIDEITSSGKSWTLVNSDQEIKNMVELYFTALNNQIKSTESDPGQRPKTTKAQSKKSQPSVKSGGSKAIEVNTENEDSNQVKQVETASDAVKFIRRYVNLNDKKKDRNQIRLFINAIQKAIREKRINKKSEFAPEIQTIQAELLKLHANYKSDHHKITVGINENSLTRYKEILGLSVEYLSIKFIKSYINLQGRVIPKEKAVNLLNRIKAAIEKGKLNSRDKYFPAVETALNNLENFISKTSRSGVLKISSQELGGIKRIATECGCPDEITLSGTTLAPKNIIMNSLDAVQLSFDKLGFKHKWLNFIGNPSRNFKMMIFGLPKMGKSILAVDFAGYLARNHGKVLYIAKEEGIDDTLIDKLNSAAHQNLDVSDYLPDDLSEYDFVFIDSVTKLGLNPKDLEKLELKYPTKSFIYIFQTTKGGKFRGSNEFQHNVDVVVEIPRKGYATQYGRYNQGGELNIFE